MFKKVLIIFSALLVLIFLSLSIVSYKALSYISSQTNTSLFYFPKTIQSAIKHPTLTTPFNFIILGLDPRHDALENTITTDTIMVGRLSDSGKVSLVSIPRDLWVYSMSSKINQVYPESLKTENHLKFIQDKFTEITGVNLSKTVIITTQTLEELTTLVGGVDVYLETGFKDTQYPNPEYIKNPSPKIPIYTTIEFKSGWIHLDNSNIAPFVRSRKSLVGGSDLGRIARQQLLLNALINKIKQPSFYYDKDRLFSLYKFYKNKIETNITDEDLISLATKLYPHISNVTLNTFSVPTGDSRQKNIIYHPDIFINRQWVFIPREPDYNSFKSFIAASLNQ